jgi:hypothetical protein
VGVVDGPLPQATVILERLDSDIDADPVAELEAVDDGPGGTRHTNGDAFDAMRVDPARERRAGDAHDPNG